MQELLMKRGISPFGRASGIDFEFDFGSCRPAFVFYQNLLAECGYCAFVASLALLAAVLGVIGAPLALR